MTVVEVVDAITNVGFPIVMVFVFLFAIKYILDTYCKKIDDQTADINSLRQEVNDIKAEVKTAIENNTEVMQELKETITLLLATNNIKKDK